MYGQQLDNNFRHETWELLRRLHNGDDLAWLVGGDFNEIL